MMYPTLMFPAFALLNAATFCTCMCQQCWVGVFNLASIGACLFFALAVEQMEGGAE